MEVAPISPVLQAQGLNGKMPPGAPATLPGFAFGCETVRRAAKKRGSVRSDAPATAAALVCFFSLPDTFHQTMRCTSSIATPLRH